VLGWRPVNQSINQSIDRSINQPTNQPTNQLVDQSNQSINAINQSTNQKISRPIQSINAKKKIAYSILRCQDTHPVARRVQDHLRRPALHAVHLHVAEEGIDRRHLLAELVHRQHLNIGLV
jgi:hypothetical protein